MPTLLYRYLAFLTLFAAIARAQTPTTCAVSAVPPIVHSEGLAERLGDIVLQCTGTPNTPVTASLSVQLPVNITNRINSSSFSTDASLTIDTGTGPVPSGVSGMVANQMISFNGFSFTIPATGRVTLTIDDLRADVNQLGLTQQMPIQAYLSGSLALQNNPINVAFAQQGLLATSMDSGVTCVGSPVPASVSLTALFAAGTVEQTTRLTEGFPQSFQPKDPTSDTGTRFLLSYANFPANATIFVPDAVAGSSAAVPTAGGDLGTTATVGQYQAGSQTLLLVRVLNAASDGSGGTFAALPAPNASGLLLLDGANPVPLANGAGYAVYEVVAANPTASETAQIPNFFGIPAYSAPASANGSVSLAPVSTVTSASTTAPIPRFAAVQPPSDCTALADCNASYYPLLQVTGAPMQLTAVVGGKRVGAGNLTIRNTRGGVLDFTATATYAPGAPTGWILFTQTSGTQGGLIQVVADPGSLPVGVYQATVVIDAGPIAGTQSFPVTMTILAAPAQPAIGSITDAADFHAGPVVPGSLAALFGANLAGTKVSVTFDGNAATLLYAGASQINLRIPPSLAGHVSSQVVVTVDGIASAPATVQLTALAPAVFNPGVLNQNSTINSPANPAAPASVLQIFGTGMPDSGAVVSVGIQNQTNLPAIYAGGAPGLPGIQQVNVAVPAGLAAGSASLVVCVASPAKQGVCSQPVTISLK